MKADKEQPVSPRFSIVIAFYNHRNFIKQALDSALSQGNPDCEIVAVDDASTDGSQQVLQQYQNRVKVICFNKNQGACAARNYGASVAKGRFLVFLDGDDTYLPWALDVYERIVETRAPKMILSTMSWFEGELPPVPDTPQEITFVDYASYLRRDRSFGNSASAMVIERAAFEEVCGWPVDLFPCEDHDLALRLGTVGRTIQILTPPTTFHRAHASYTATNVETCCRAAAKLVQKEQSGNYRQIGEAFYRKALIGGVVFYWAKRAVKKGLYGVALRLIGCGWPMLMAGILRRAHILFEGHQPIETLPIKSWTAQAASSGLLSANDNLTDG